MQTWRERLYGKLLSIGGFLAIVVLPLNAHAFPIDMHDQITNEALLAVAVANPADPSDTMRFTDERRHQIASCIGAVDLFTQAQPAQHFDSEQINEGSLLIAGFTATTIESLRSDESASDFGIEFPGCQRFRPEGLDRSLHALQDFYAHSNYVNRRLADIEMSDAEEFIGWPPHPPSPDPTDDTCEDGRPDRPLLGALTSGYFSIRDLTDEMGCFCSQSPGLPQSADKCQHGFAAPSRPDCPLCENECMGINKDTVCGTAGASSCVGEECLHNHAFHEQAKSEARLATTRYIERLIDELPCGEPVLVCRLLGYPDERCEGQERGSAQRYVNTGLTVIDLETGLEWEKKTEENVTDMFSACIGEIVPGAPPLRNGTLYTEFLPRLNTEPCYAGHCDWRLPKIASIHYHPTDPTGTATTPTLDPVAELETLLLDVVTCEGGYCEGCEATPCIDCVFEPTTGASETHYDRYLYHTDSYALFEDLYGNVGAVPVKLNFRDGVAFFDDCHHPLDPHLHKARAVRGPLDGMRAVIDSTGEPSRSGHR